VLSSSIEHLLTCTSNNNNADEILLYVKLELSARWRTQISFHVDSHKSPI